MHLRLHRAGASRGARFFQISRCWECGCCWGLAVPRCCWRYAFALLAWHALHACWIRHCCCGICPCGAPRSNMGRSLFVGRLSVCLYVCMSVYPPICLTRGGLWQDLNGMITMLLAMVPPQFLVPHLPKSCDDWLAQGRARQQARRVGLCAATPARPLLPVLRYVVVDGTLPLCRRLGRAPVRTALLKGLMPCTVFC